jgi:hypothetical protein
MTVRLYASPEAFKQALEQRLRTDAKTGVAFARRRQLLVFDRFLARVVAVLGTAGAYRSAETGRRHRHGAGDRASNPAAAARPYGPGHRCRRPDRQ